MFGITLHMISKMITKLDVWHWLPVLEAVASVDSTESHEKRVMLLNMCAHFMLLQRPVVNQGLVNLKSLIKQSINMNQVLCALVFAYVYLVSAFVYFEANPVTSEQNFNMKLMGDMFMSEEFDNITYACFCYMCVPEQSAAAELLFNVSSNLLAENRVTEAAELLLGEFKLKENLINYETVTKASTRLLRLCECLTKLENIQRAFVVRLIFSIILKFELDEDEFEQALQVLGRSMDEKMAFIEFLNCLRARMAKENKIVSEEMKRKIEVLEESWREAKRNEEESILE